MYQFILNMWIMKKITGDQVNKLVTLNRLTLAEAQIILSTPQAQ
jgi:hypothetical protein